MMAKADGSFRLYALESKAQTMPELGQVLSQKFQGEQFKVQVEIKLGLQDGEETGMLVLGRSYAGLLFRRQGADLELHTVVYEGKEERIEKIRTLPFTETMHLQLRVDQGGMCHFLYQGEALLVFQAREGVWIGAKWGIFAKRQHFTNDSGFVDVLRWSVE